MEAACSKTSDILRDKRVCLKRFRTIPSTFKEGLREERTSSTALESSTRPLEEKTSGRAGMRTRSEATRAFKARERK